MSSYLGDSLWSKSFKVAQYLPGGDVGGCMFNFFAIGLSGPLGSVLSMLFNIYMEPPGRLSHLGVWHHLNADDTHLCFFISGKHREATLIQNGCLASVRTRVDKLKLNPNKIEVFLGSGETDQGIEIQLVLGLQPEKSRLQLGCAPGFSLKSGCPGFSGSQLCPVLMVPDLVTERTCLSYILMWLCALGRAAFDIWLYSCSQVPNWSYITWIM